MTNSFIFQIACFPSIRLYIMFIAYCMFIRNSLIIILLYYTIILYYYMM